MVRDAQEEGAWLWCRTGALALLLIKMCSFWWKVCSGLLCCGMLRFLGLILLVLLALIIALERGCLCCTASLVMYTVFLVTCCVLVFFPTSIVLCSFYRLTVFYGSAFLLATHEHTSRPVSLRRFILFVIMVWTTRVRCFIVCHLTLWCFFLGHHVFWPLFIMNLRVCVCSNSFLCPPRVYRAVYTP